MDHLDVAAFAKANAVIEGEEPVSAFERLAQEAHASVDGMMVSWYAEGEHEPETGGPGQLWLHLDACGALVPLCEG